MLISVNKNKPILYILAVIFFACLIVAILCLCAENPYNKKNGFTRTFFSDSINLFSSAEIKKDEVVSVGGAADSHIYFQTKFPSQLLITDFTLSNKQSLQLPIKNDLKVSSNFNTYIDSPLIFVYARNVPSVFVYNCNTLEIKTYYVPCSIFTREVNIASNSVVLRGFSKNIIRDQLFMKTHLGSDSLEVQKNITEDRTDAGISTDGLLHFDSETNLLTFVFFYHNKILCLDTSLNILYSINTIDTVTSLETTVAGVSGKDKKTISYSNATPLAFNNLENCVQGGKVFNSSALKADNESKASFFNNSVIDVYSLRKKQYIGSFYLPDYKGQKMRRFKVFKNLLVAVYEHSLVVYRLPPHML